MKQNSLLFGLNYSNLDFSKPASLGKNTFTNAFPLALAQHIHSNKAMPIPVIEAQATDSGLCTMQRMCSWEELIDVSAEEAAFLFETVYDGYRPYTKLTPNKSDVVVANKEGKHTRSFEVKLVVVPNSQSANKPHDEQSCELVVRPPSIEQLAFSIASSYGAERRSELLGIIVDCLDEPMDYLWSNREWMQAKMSNIYLAAEEIISAAIKFQTPFALSAVWRTIGQAPVLEQNAFDIFCWTDMAFVQLFLDKRPTKLGERSITRTERSLVWLVSSLYDYAAQRTLNFEKHHSKITYGTQTDKAGSFAGDVTFKHLNSEQFCNPRVHKDELPAIVSDKALDSLMPERRLDGVLVTQRLLSLQSQNQ